MPGRLKKFLLSVWEVVEVVFVATATVFLIRSFLVQPFLVSGASMEPNFSDGNYLIIDEITYRFRSPERGEVVVFRFPKDPSVFFIKRIIGLPGERIANSGNGIIVYHDIKDTTGKALTESYLSRDSVKDRFDVWLNNDEYFVLGDNRNASFDSRSWGPIKREAIVGVVRIRVFPLQKFNSFTPPRYETAGQSSAL